MDISRTFDVNGRALKIICNEPELPAAPSDFEMDGVAPGAGNFEIGPMKLSADEIAPGESLSLSVQISGSNIAFIYTEILFQDQEQGLYYGPVVQEYVHSATEEDVQGVIYPIWDSEIKLEINITSALRVLTDGVDSAFAFMYPTNYAQDGRCLDGLFTRAGGDSPRRAQIKFNSAGEITGILVFKEKGGHSMPHALTMMPGDQFTPFVQILTCPGDENPVWQTARGTSTTLTLRETALRCVNEAPIAGNYLLGLVVEDMDGEKTRQYVPFTLME